MCNNAEGLTVCGGCCGANETALAALEYAIKDREDEIKGLKVIRESISWSNLSLEDDAILRNLFYKLL